MSNLKMTPDAVAWPCPDCNGRGIVTERLQEFYHGVRAGRPAEDYCESCLTQGHCPVCGAEALWDEETGASSSAPNAVTMPSALAALSIARLSSVLAAHGGFRAPSSRVPDGSSCAT